MIQGALRYADELTMYSQVNNPTESLLQVLNAEAKSGGLSGIQSWMESCGPTAAVMCLAAMGVDVTIKCPGVYEPQPEEVLMDFFNDPRNATRLASIRNLNGVHIPENRVPQFYPFAVDQVFGAKAVFKWALSWAGVSGYVWDGYPVQICLKSPSHYVAVVAYDRDAVELIYNDPWTTRFQDGKGGWHRRLGYDDFISNVKDYFVVYGISGA